MQQYWQEFRKQGLGFVVVSYDSVDILVDFAKCKGITYPMLSDPQSKIIKTFGIMNARAKKTDMRYGTADPGIFRVGAEGTILSKYFAEDVSERYPTPSILLGEFGSLAGEHEYAATNDYAGIKYYSVDNVRPASHIVLAVDITLKPGKRVLAAGSQKNTPEDLKKYVPLSLEIDPDYFYMAQSINYPRPESRPMPAATEPLLGYEGTVRILQDVMIQGRDTLSELPPIKIKGKLRFQPCDDKTCYEPQTVPIEWNMKMTGLEYEHSPDRMQHMYASEDTKAPR